MKDTFTLFMDFLRSNREEIKNSLEMAEGSWRRELYGTVFRENFIAAPKTEPVTGKAVSSTDSTEFIRELYNGKKLILIRAYTVLGKKIYPSFISEVISVSRDDLQQFTIMLMEHSEHLSIIEMLKEESPDYILVDGSLTGRVFRKFRALNAEGYREFSRKYMEALGIMLDAASAKGIPIIYMAKSSESKLFRTYLLSQVKQRKHREETLREEEGLSASDHFLVKSLARDAGYTVPLLQAVPRIWGEGRFPVLTTHLLPRVNDLPLKVDVVFSTEGQAPDTTEASRLPEDVLNLLFWGYGDLKTYNIWLADVDRLVKFRNSEVENIYMKAFEREIGVSFYETRGERRARLRI